jgi:tetratricopeptide (TPR) repeat protein/protein involved in polysaccharide export with SLBB domain
VYRCIACLTVLLLASPLNAQKVGDKLIVVAESAAKLKMGDSTVGTIPRGECVTVESVGDGRFQVTYEDQRPWIAKGDLMAIGEAIAYFTKTIAKKPQAPDYFGRGNAWFEKGDHDKAIADFSEVIRLEPKSDRAYSFRGGVNMAKGDVSGDTGFYTKAVADFTKALDLHPTTASLWYNRGSGRIRTGDFDGAIADLTEAIRLDARFANAYIARGATHILKRDFDKAIADYSEALRLDPNSANTYADRGAAYAQKNDLDRAIADETQAIRIDPKLASAYGNRAEMWRLKDDPDKAIADYTETARLDPKNPSVYIGRGWTWLLKGDSEKSIADYTEAIRNDPKSSDAYARRGDAWCWKGDYDKAIADYTEALRLDSAHAGACARRPWAERRRKHAAKAAGDSLALAGPGKSPCDHEFRAALLIERGSHDRGLAGLRTAIRLNPNDQAATFEPWPKTPITARALRHGQRQLAAMLKDRPTLAEHGKSAEPLYQWAIRKFAGEDLGEEIFWASAHLDWEGVNYPPSDEIPGCIMVAERHGSGKTTDERVSFDEMWNTVVFELYNITNAAAFEELDRQATKGELSRSQYVAKTMKIESRAAEKTRSFYIHVYLPWAMQHRVATYSPSWHTGTRADPSEGLVQSYDENHPSWRAYRKKIEANYDNVTAAAKAEKARQSAEQPAKQPSAKPEPSGSSAKPVPAPPNESHASSRPSSADRRIEPFDLLTVWVRGVLDEYPIQKRLLVEPSGSVSLGPAYGRVKLQGLTLDQAETAIKKHLEETFRSVNVEVLAAGRAVRWAEQPPQPPYRIRPGDPLQIEAVGVLPNEPINAGYRIDANGQIQFGKTYGSVSVKGLTNEEAENAVTEHLKELFVRPKASVTFTGWKRDPERPTPRKPPDAPDKKKPNPAGK